MPRDALKTGLPILLTLFSASLFAVGAQAYSPDSPEVKQLVKEGLAYLDLETNNQLGGRCVIALAYLKSGVKDHPRISEAVTACIQSMKKGDQGNPQSIYSCGIAIIFLCDYDSRRYSDLIRYYLEALQKRQKENGAWGYRNEKIGDTSQTQYGALSMWEAHQYGFRSDPNSVREMVHWLIRTQDPSGGWTYKGEESEMGKRVAQEEINITPSITSAAMGSLLIAADLFGILKPGAEEQVGEPVPKALRAANENTLKAPPLTPSGLNHQLMFKAVKDGAAWMDVNYKVKNPRRFQLYYLYALERYRTLEGVLQGDLPDKPDWYNNGVKWLMENKDPKGGWLDGCGRPVDTAFAVLFLQRSMLKSLNKSIEGTLVSGRGLPARLETLKLSRGQVVVQRAQTAVGDLVNMLSDEEGARLDALLDDPTALVGEISSENGRRFESIARGGEPTARILAVRALGSSGDLDYAPTLIYALTDPDKRVVIEARDGLRFLSRRFNGFGLPNSYEDRELRDAIEKWKQWYLTVRPDAAISLN